MSPPAIDPHDPHPRRRIPVLDAEMATVDTGVGTPVVLLHGNPTSSYLWRNVIPHVTPLARCLAPDLIGMGESAPAPRGRYRFADHARYLDAWFDAVAPSEPLTLVMHDWGSALGFHWARRHPRRVRALVYMEAIVQPLTWAQWPQAARGIFQGLRSDKGETLVLERNVFVERILPASVLRELGAAEMARYRAPFAEAGERRRPTLTWPREIPIDGEPADVTRLVSEYGEWLRGSGLPKLFVNADPGSILTGTQREFCRTWPNQREVTVPGLHFIQEDSPHQIGEAIAALLRELG